MSKLFKDEEEVFSLGSFVIDGKCNPCGHNGLEGKPRGQSSLIVRLQITNIVKDGPIIAECPTCCITWDDEQYE